MNSYLFPKQTGYYRGKVRDVYTIDNRYIIMVASNRISAFDVILPEPIPDKGQLLNQLSAYMLQETQSICPNWLLSIPAANVSFGIKCVPFKIEMVVRGNLTGHAWRTYQSGKRVLCGVTLPESLRENDFFNSPIITPSTKADAGHDEDISREEIIAQNLVSENDYAQLEQYALALFKKGKEMAAKRGLILADTKYEFGKYDGRILLMDEIHTPDSSRYFYAENFEENLKLGKKQTQLSKEFVREWLITNNFMGQKGQVVPLMDEEWISSIRSRYIKLYEVMTGKQFIPERLSEEETKEKIITILESYLK